MPYAHSLRRGVPKSGNPARQSRPRPVACYRKVRLALATSALSLSFALSLSLCAWLKVLKNFSNFREPKKVQVAFYCVKNVRFHKGLCTIRSRSRTRTHTLTQTTHLEGLLAAATPLAGFTVFFACSLLSAVIDLCARKRA